jgi:hypothetical protein
LAIKYTEKLADEICERLSLGESLRAICEDAHMPTETAVRKWAVNDVNGFSSRYTSAREAQADHYAEEIVTIADTAEDANLARLRVDARKWFASKVAPKRYGDKITQQLTGPEGGSVTFVLGVPRLPDDPVDE